MRNGEKKTFKYLCRFQILAFALIINQAGNLFRFIAAFFLVMLGRNRSIFTLIDFLWWNQRFSCVFPSESLFPCNENAYSENCEKQTCPNFLFMIINWQWNHLSIDLDNNSIELFCMDRQAKLSFSMFLGANLANFICQPFFFILENWKFAFRKVSIKINKMLGI